MRNNDNLVNHLAKTTRTAYGRFGDSSPKGRATFQGSGRPFDPPARLENSRGALYSIGFSGGASGTKPEREVGQNSKHSARTFPCQLVACSRISRIRDCLQSHPDRRAAVRSIRHADIRRRIIRIFPGSGVGEPQQRPYETVSVPKRK